MHTENRPSAPVTPENAQRASAQPLERKVRLTITESEAAKAGISDRFNQILRVREAKRLRIERESSELLRTLELLVQIASQKFLIEHPNEDLTTRKLAQTANFPESTLRWLRKGAASNPQAFTSWLPKLQAALSKLKPS